MRYPSNACLFVLLVFKHTALTLRYAASRELPVYLAVVLVLQSSVMDVRYVMHKLICAVVLHRQHFPAMMKYQLHLQLPVLVSSPNADAVFQCVK